MVQGKDARARGARHAFAWHGQHALRVLPRRRSPLSPRLGDRPRLVERHDRTIPRRTLRHVLISVGHNWMGLTPPLGLGSSAT